MAKESFLQTFMAREPAEGRSKSINADMYLPGLL
jgi:hypothetical protein